MSIVKVNQENFKAEVLETQEAVLVDFYAEWCGPCKMIAPLLENIAAENPHIKVAKVNIDDSQELAMKYGVMSVPTLMVFKKGEPGKPMVGAGSAKQILGLLE